MPAKLEIAWCASTEAAATNSPAGSRLEPSVDGTMEGKLIDTILPILLLNFGSVSGTIVRQAGYAEISVISQKLSVPLIVGGIIAGFVAIYCAVVTEGWIAGLLIWIVSGLVLAAVAKAVRARMDGILSILGVLSLISGLYLFFVRFL